MIIHNLKLIIRNLWSNRIYTSIILMSLIVAFVCSSILIAFLVYENDTDKFHLKYDRIFQVFSNDPFADDERIVFMPRTFDYYLSNSYPEVEEVAQIVGLDKISVETESVAIHDFNTLLIDKSFLSVFDFSFEYGSKDSSLSNNDIILSQEKALLLFGDSNAAGRVITFITPDTTKQLVVSAVINKPSANSHLSFDALIHRSVLPDKWTGGPTYALLAENNTPKSLQDKINIDVERPSLLGLGKMSYFLQPLAQSYFSSENNMSYMNTRNPTFLKVGYIVCGLILFIAGFNFINLFLLFWQSRRKEMGIKKALGITQKSLFGYSFTEAGFYIGASFVISIIITILVIPIFNSVFEANLSPYYLLNFEVVAYIGIVLFLSGFLIVLFSISKQWRIKPISLMKNDSSKVSFNGYLFTFQFVISITLTICSICIIKQMNHVKNAPLGFNRKIIQLDSPEPRYAKSLAILKQQISQMPNVDGVTVSGGNPISGNTIVRYELDDQKFYTPYLFGGDEDFINTLNLNLVEGNLPSSILKGKIVNEKLVNQFGMKNPIGKNIPGTEDIIIGVVEDFTCGSFKEEIPPVIISYYDDGQSLLIDYGGMNLASLLPNIQTKWKQLFPNHFFSYLILEEELKKKYNEETFFYNIILTFSIISIILASFGLFALSWAVTQGRSKEMGIRKILGATKTDIFNLLTLVFGRRIIIAFIISTPIGYYLMHQWLAHFANRIDLSIWIFATSGIIVIFISLTTLSIQTIKATLKSPINEIRTE